jgi:hypothetical protein
MAGRPEYEGSGLLRFFMGSGYRALWTTPIDVPVLDLRTFAGGLKPVRQVGSMQSLGLALAGADGKSYTFRTTDKDPTRILPPEWKETVPEKLFQDSTTANHPGVGFVVPPLAEAAGVLHTDPRYVFMPDDPALGEFRGTFGGKPGTIDEYPLPGRDGVRGFAGATEILSTLDLWKRHLDGAARVDERALVRARLFDLWIGDWDRHNKQWRWLRRGEGAPFEPLPEDRDQAFCRFSGVLLAATRAANPKFMDWKDHYENFEGFMTQGTEIDRWLLSGVGAQAFAEAAAELAGRLTDEVIDGAVRRLPAEWYAIDGDALIRALQMRRDTLPAGAAEYYRRLSRKVDVHGTNEADLALVTRGPDGRLELELRREPGGEPWFRRTFVAGETQEVRVYLYGGDDRVATQGRADGPIVLRAIAGPGTDALDDSASGGTRFYGPDAGSKIVKGPGTRVDRSDWERRPAKPAETPWLEGRDWGARTIPQYQVWYEPDPGVVLAGGFRRQTWGFRKFPSASVQAVQLQFSTGRQDFKFNYDGEFRRENSKRALVVDLQLSGLENLNYFGAGNGTPSVPPEGRDDDFFDARSDTYRLTLGPRWDLSRNVKVHLGAEAKLTHTPTDQDTFIGSEDPYGTGGFAQAGVKAGFDFDTRAPRAVGLQALKDDRLALSGIRLEGEGFYYPKAGDVRSAFGGVEGKVRGYLMGRRAMLAAKVGGRRLFGDYPWFESAFVGGSPNLRGYRRDRFAGDGSLYGSLEARLWLFRGKLIAPGRWGLFGLTDTGRVFLEGDTSDAWHATYGGGVFFQMLTLHAVFHAAVAHGDEGTRFYVDYGFNF